VKRYKVLVSFQPNINRLDREEESFTVSAPSKPSAIFQAGRQLGLTQKGYVPGSETVTVIQIGTAR
jgi:hypothetical protein